MSKPVQAKNRLSVFFLQSDTNFGNGKVFNRSKVEDCSIFISDFEKLVWSFGCFPKQTSFSCQLSSFCPSEFCFVGRVYSVVCRVVSSFFANWNILSRLCSLFSDVFRRRHRRNNFVL